jgi:hypothetical protein
MNGFKKKTPRTRHSTRIKCDEQLSQDDISNSLSKTDTDSDKGHNTRVHST